jgi:hypothetical protein
MKVKWKNSGLASAHMDSSLQKALKAWRKPPSGDLDSISKTARAPRQTSLSVNRRRCSAKPRLLP